ncbi:MAG: hypothetical protein WAM18_06420, partial [Halobacillus sp.]|uniref:hypothetical protein n=1 Tax=Halobacillus sp. TaxID=56800 RepID=UPI003BAEC102
MAAETTRLVPSPRHSRHKPLINGLKNRNPFDGRLMLVVSVGVIPHLNTFLRGNWQASSVVITPCGVSPSS